MKDEDSLIRNKAKLMFAYYKSLTIDKHNNVLVDEGKMVTLIKKHVRSSYCRAFKRVSFCGIEFR